MSVIKKDSTGFTQVVNRMLNDKTITARAKGVYAYLFSKPVGWDFNYIRVAEDHKEGKNTILKAIQELESSGYLTRKRLKTGRIEYHLKCKPLPKVRSDQSSVRPECGHVSNKDKKETKNKRNKDLLQTKVCEEVPNLLNDKQKHIQIIGLYARAKQTAFKNKEQQSSFIKRNLRGAKNLIGYEFNKIAKTMKYLIDNADFKWTLETVGKYIDEDLTNLNNKQDESEKTKSFFDKY